MADSMIEKLQATATMTNGVAAWAETPSSKSKTTKQQGIGRENRY